MSTGKADMRLTVNSDKCQGIGMCEERLPELFEIQRGGYAVLLQAEVPEGLEGEVRAAVARCPTGSLSLAD